MHYDVSNPNKVSARVFDDEVVIANFETGIYYSLMGSAADVWIGLTAGVSLEKVAEVLGERCERGADAFRTALDGFVAELESDGLIRPVERVGDADWEPPVQVASLGFPVLERHSDMQDLLLLDPVHDVSEAGWPHLPPSA